MMGKCFIFVQFLFKTKTRIQNPENQKPENNKKIEKKFLFSFTTKKKIVFFPKIKKTNKIENQ